MYTLNNLQLGNSARVRYICCTDEAIHRRILDLGLIKNTIIKALYKSPSGDPVAYEIKGAVIALRSEITSQIFVEVI